MRRRGQERRTGRRALWMVTFADLMSLLVCFFVLMISFSVPDTQKLKIVAGSMRDAFGFQREMIVTGMVEIDGNPRYQYRPGPGAAADQGAGRADPGGQRGHRGAERARGGRSRTLREIVDPYIVDGRRSTRWSRPSAPSRARSSGSSRSRPSCARRSRRCRSSSGWPRTSQIERAPEGLRIQIVDQERRLDVPARQRADVRADQGSAGAGRDRDREAAEQDLDRRPYRQRRVPAAPTATTTGRCRSIAPTRPGAR